MARLRRPLFGPLTLGEAMLTLAAAPAFWLALDVAWAALPA